MSESDTQWVAIVLESLSEKDVEAWAIHRSVPLDELAMRRAIFLAGGCEAMREGNSGGRWIQIESALEDDPGAAHLLASGLADHVAEWIRTEKVRHFSFLHKPPGLRLRFYGDSPPLRDIIEARFLSGGQNGWRFSFYEPEGYQFGGSKGMELAHEFFTIESLAILRFRECLRHGQKLLDDGEFSLLLLNQLLSNIAADRWELWDIWCNMRLTGRLTEEELRAPANVTSLCSQWLPLLFEAGVAEARMSAGERDILERFRTRASELASAIRELGRGGELLWPIRQILPFWIIFHWNRMMFPLERQRELARVMCAVLCPKR